jgi:hypothetical protein
MDGWEVGAMSEQIPIPPEQLLGGYATDTLTEEERRRLFEAALHDQELFNALADEEVLRQLLSDPKVRKRLLAVLPAERKVVSFWRRPAVLGLAASFLMTLVVLVQTRRHPIHIPLHEPPVAEKAVTPSKQTDASKPASAVTSDVMAQPSSRSVAPVPAPASVAAPPPLVTEQELRVEAPAANMAAQAPVVADVPRERAKLEDAVLAEAPKKVKQAAPMSIKGESVQKEEKAYAPAPSAVGGALVSGAASPIESRMAKKIAKADSSESEDKPNRLSPPITTLESMGSNHYRLRVQWEATGHLYVLLRSKGTSQWLKSTLNQGATHGLRQSTFEFSASEAVVDVYLLESVTEHPESLPVEGAVQGYRKRLVP